MSTQYTQKTKWANKGERPVQWLVFDATGKTLGRFASEIAKVLRGKHTPMFTPNIDAGDGVIVLNAEKIAVTGDKETKKHYRHHTGHMGGLREIPYNIMMQRHPERIIERAVWGMLPHTKLGRQQIKRLKVFIGGEHNLQAQQPVLMNI